MYVLLTIYMFIARMRERAICHFRDEKQAQGGPRPFEKGIPKVVSGEDRLKAHKTKP